MKRKLYFFIAFYVFIFSCNINLYCQWQSLGPNGGRVVVFEQVGNDIYLGTSAGVFKSTDDGENWVSKSNGLPVDNLRVVVLKYLNGKLFAGTVSDNIYVSVDGGETWNPTNNGISGTSATVTDIKGYGGLIFTSLNGSIFLSDDGGQNWKKSTNGFPLPGAITGYDFFELNGELYVLSSRGFYVYSSADNSWTRQDTISSILGSSLTKITKNDNSLFVGSRGIDGGVYYSSDTGRSWQLLHKPSNGIRYLLFYNKRLLVGTDDGIEVSDTTLSLWTKVGGGFPQLARVEAIQYFENIGLFAATEEGVYKSTDDGKTWEAKNKGITNTRVRGIRNFNNQLLISANNIGVLSQDATQQDKWNKKNIGVVTTANFAINNSILFVAAQNNGVYTSTDGNTWEQKRSSYTSFVKAYKDEVYAGGLDKLFKTSNEGDSWDTVGKTLPNISISNIAVKGDTIVVTGWKGNVYISENGGDVWKQRFVAGFATVNINEAAIVNNKIFVGGHDSGMFVLKDMNQAWERINNGLGNDRRINYLTTYGNTLLLGTPNSLYSSIDEGETWQSHKDNLPDGLQVYEIYIDPNNAIMYLGTDAGVWQHPLSEITNVRNITKQIGKLKIYPNPNKGDFRISVGTVSGETSIKVEMYDMLGKRVYINEYIGREIQDDKLQIKVYQPSGIYLLKVQKGNEVLVERVVLE